MRILNFPDQIKSTYILYMQDVAQICSHSEKSQKNNRLLYIGERYMLMYTNICQSVGLFVTKIKKKS